MTAVKYDYGAWVLRKADEGLLDVFQRSCLMIVLGTPLTDRISTSRLYENCCSFPLSRIIMKERLGCLGYALRMKDDRLSKIFHFGQPYKAKWKASCRRLGWEHVIKKFLRDMGTSREVVKRKALNKLGWKRSMRSFVSLRQLGARVGC